MLPPTDAILLYEYRPNGAGPGRQFYYSGRLEKLLEGPRELTTGARRGYLVRFRSGLLDRRSIALFGEGESIRIDDGSGPADLLPIPATIASHGLKKRVTVQTPVGARVIQVFTPPWRYFLNDGVVPEDVEPIVRLLADLTDSDSRQRFVTYFTSGNWPEDR